MTQAASQSSPVSHPKTRIFFIVIIAFVLRLLFLGARSFWADEIVSVKLATDNWGGFWFWLSTREANMALYYLLLREWIKFGETETWVRLFSALAGIITIPVLYALAKELYDDRAAWIIALLAATNACLIDFSQQARSYSLTILLVTLSYYLFVRMVREGDAWMALAYVFASILSLYAHFFSALVIVAQALSILWLPRNQVRWSNLIPAWMAIGLGALPISFYVLKRDVGQLYWVQPTTFSEVYKLAIFFAGGSKAVAAILSGLSLAGIGAAIANNRNRLRRRSEPSWRFILALLGAVVPVGSTILVSLHKPVFVHRYLLVALPAYLILLGVGLARIQKPALLASALIVFIGLSSLSIAQGYFRPVEDWRGAVDHILDRAQPGDALTVYIPYAMNNFNFYRARHSRTPIELLAPLTSADQARSIATPRLWVMIYPSPHTAEQAPLFKDILKEHYATEEQTQFKGIEVLLYTEPKQPPSRLPEESTPRR
jgi:mannosyltransferase